MNKNELWQLYCEREKQVENARNKRAITTVSVFAVAIFLIIHIMESPSETEIIGNILISIIFAGIYFVVNATIFGQLARIGENERKMLEDIKKRMDEAER